MKKYKFFVLILLITLITSIGVNATTVDGDYSYTTYDNEGYDLITGEALENINMSRTNRVEIARNSIDDKIYFNDDNFSHVLFFNSSNIFIGYGNGGGSTRELSTYIGDVVPDGSDYSIEVPENARKFALMNYNYEDTRNLIMYTPPSIDDNAWGDLSYRDIFENTDLIANGDFNDTHIEYNTTRNLFNIDDIIDFTYFDFTILDNDSFQVTSTAPNGAPTFYEFANDIVYKSNTQYTISLTTWVSTTDGNFVLYAVYTDATFQKLWTPNTNPYDEVFTTASGKTVDYIGGAYHDNGTPVTTYIDNLQIEEGTVATDYIAYQIPYDDPDNWELSTPSDGYIDVIDGVANSIFLVNYPFLRVQQDLGFIPTVDDYYYVSVDYGMEDNTNAFDGAIGLYNGGLSTYLQFVFSFESPDELQHFSDIGVINTDIGGNLFIRIQYYYSGNTLELTNYLDNVKSYNLTDIGFVLYPTVEEFETMKLYYDTYKDAVDEVSYNDIFTNNLILNGEMTNSTSGIADYWDMGVNFDTYTITGDAQYFIGVGGVGSSGNWFSQTVSNIESTYFLSFDSKHYNLQEGFENLYVSEEFVVSIATIDLTRTMTNYSYIFPADFGRDALIFASDVELQTLLDNVILYDLISIFGYVDDEITTDLIELHYQTWLDPYGDTYPNYYQVATLIVNTVYYKYDDTPPAPADFQTSFDDKLVSIGVDTPQEEIFGAFLIMIVVAVLLGLKFKSVAIVMIAELSLIFIFTVLGWFSLWFILVLALTFVLLILLKALKGGQK